MSLDTVLSLPKGTLLSSEEYKKIASNILLNPLATEDVINALKAVPKGEQPMDLIFAVKYEDSLNYRKYTTKAYRAIVQQILEADVFIPVFFGHQNPEQQGFEARQIAGSVIGAFLDEQAGVIYYRIIPDASDENKDIRRWIRNKQINALSIWGYTASDTVQDGIEIIDDFFLLSVDLVPPLTQGQENVGLVISEITKKRTKVPFNKNKMESDMANNEMQLKDVSNLQLTSEMASRLKDGRMSARIAVGEMTGAGLAEEAELQQKTAKVQELQAILDDFLKKLQALGFKDFEELLSYVTKTKKEAEEMKQKEDFEKVKSEIFHSKGLLKDNKPTGVMHSLVEKWAMLTVGMSRAEMEKSIDKVLTDEGFKRMASENVGAEGRTVGSSNAIGSEAENEVYTI